MKIITDFLLKLSGIIVVLFGFWKWGKADSEKELIEVKNKDLLKENKNNEEIDSLPFVDNPFYWMSKKD